MAAMIVLAIAAAAPPARAAAAVDDDVRQLLEGVSTIAAPGVPGTVAAHGEGAFVVVAGPAGDPKTGRRVPVVAAAKYGQGRVVVFGHDGYLMLKPGEGGDTGRLMANIVRWCGGGAGAGGPSGAAAARPAGAVRCAAVGRLAESIALPADVGTVERVRSVAEAMSAPKPPAVIFATVLGVRDLEPAQVIKYVSGGGSLVLGGTGWGWLQVNPGKTLNADHPGNTALAAIGLAWTDGMTGPDENKLIRVEAPDQATLHAGKALEALAKPAPAGAAPGELVRPPGRKGPPPIRRGLGQVGEIVMQAARAVPAETAFMKRLRGLQGARGAALVPTEKTPVKSADGLARVLISMDAQDWKHQPAEKVKAHAAAANFPGPVPASAPRVSRAVDVDTAIPRWHSTGLYAAPGEVVTVSVPASAAGKGLSVRIGAHTDRIYHLDEWKRVPEVAAAWPIKAAQTKVASPYGGPVYIEVPSNAAGETINVQIAGAVEAPYYVRGKTTAAEWKAIRGRPAPWAELASSKLILTVPSEVVRDLEDPEALMAHWDAVMDATADLATIPRQRKSPERIATDVQISAGYMHSGYPIMTHLDVKRNIVDVAKLRQVDAGWGFYHEIGHNHQQRDWTFEGTGEVTVNLFTMHTLETACGATPEQATARAIGPRMQPKIKAYLARPDFEKWKADPFLALAMYAQLRQGFGWETYKKVFAEYRARPREQRPRTEMEQHDQWMVRFSRAAGKNLGPFFQAWGIPTSEAARKSIADLPGWMPNDMTR